MLDAPASLVTDVQRQASARPELRTIPAGEETKTRDGVPIRLEANIELLSDVVSARHQGADGVGLYRLEFLLMDRRRKNSPKMCSSKSIVRCSSAWPRPVTVRTFDIDEDQLVARHHAMVRPSWSEPAEHGRSRSAARHPVSAETAGTVATPAASAPASSPPWGPSHHVPVHIGSGGVQGSESCARRCDGRTESSRRIDGRRSGWCVIEVPSAAFTSDPLAREADFLTIGTNDLIQCCLAVDRTDDRVSHLRAAHPSILRLIRMVRRAASRQGRAVSVCGEMASDPVLLALLVGMGLTSFSMAPSAIPTARQVLAEADARSCAAWPRTCFGSRAYRTSNVPVDDARRRVGRSSDK